MKRFYYLFVSAMIMFAVSAKADNISKKLQAVKTNPVAQFQKSHSSNALAFSASKATTARRISDFDKDGELKDAESFGFLTGDDGLTWSYTLTLIPTEDNPYFYTGATISLYDSKGTLVKTVNCSVPEGLRVNDIEPFGSISTKFYDFSTSTKEFTVYMHEVGPGYTSIGHFFVYNTNGELVNQYDNMDNLIWFDGSQKYDTYQRAVFVTSGTDEEGNATTRLSVMKPASWSSPEPSEEHVFEVRDALIDYSNGPCLNMYSIDGKPYYMLSYYEKPFESGWDENYDIILTKDNNYVVEIYDKNYNLVSNFKVPVASPEGVYCSLYSCGIYSRNDLSRGYFSGDDNFNVIISRNDIRLDTDDDNYPYAFLVYNEDGTLINTIAENAISWKQMASICGESDQVGCICLNGDKMTVEMTDVPSCEKVAVFEAETEGRRISGNFDRYPVSGEAYQYVIGIDEADMDAEGNIISLIGWYNRDGSLDHYTKFNIGPSGEYFTPLIESYSLDPSLFNTDSGHEYIFIAKQRRTDGSNKIDNVLVIADEEGNTLQRYSDDDERTLIQAAIIDTEQGSPRLVVAYVGNQSSAYDVDFYNLPFVKFEAGGDGSAANPYIITSPGDLKQMASEPKAHYVLGNSIDMSEIAAAWIPVEEFFGTLDGKGFSIDNLYIDTDESYAGLFGYVEDEGSRIHDLYFTDPTIVINSGNRYAGVVAGMTLSATIDNVFVTGLKAFGDGDAQFGGIAGQATYYSKLESNFVKDADINLPGCMTVGGIVGDTRTSTNTDACLFSGTLTARNTVGGIAGATGKDCFIRNCHVNATVKGENTVGGVVGSADRYEISHNFVEGIVEATSTNMYGNACVGGVAGSVRSLWQETPEVFINENVVAATAINAPEGATAVHRIVGFTIADEQYEEGEEHKAEHGLDNNYAINSLEATAEKGKTLVDGADVVTISKAFLESIGFKYGMDAASPWTGNDYPTLYFEDNEPTSGINNMVPETRNLKPGTYNISGQRVSDNAKGLIIRNGKKFFIK